MSEQQEILYAVEELNDRLYDKYGEKLSHLGFSVEIHSDRWIQVKFGDMNICNSELDDDRVYYEATDSYEPWLDYIIRRFNRTVTELNLIEL